MRRILCFVLLVLVALMLNGCGKQGNIENVNIVEVDSEVFTQKEIDSAIDAVLRHFSLFWSGCTLTEIRYAGDDYWEMKCFAEADEAGKNDHFDFDIRRGFLRRRQFFPKRNG